MIADGGDFSVKRGEGGRGAVLDAEGDAHGSGDADGHGATNDHVADDGGDFLVGSGEDVGFFKGEAGLIEERNAFRKPFEGRDHCLF